MACSIRRQRWDEWRRLRQGFADALISHPIVEHYAGETEALRASLAEVERQGRESPTVDGLPEPSIAEGEAGGSATADGPAPNVTPLPKPERLIEHVEMVVPFAGASPQPRSRWITRQEADRIRAAEERQKEAERAAPIDPDPRPADRPEYADTFKCGCERGDL
jgi:hypothetical protein